VWGTLVAVLLLAVGISGLQHLGSSYFVEPLFNGLTLIAAVVLAAYGERRRSGALDCQGRQGLPLRDEHP
jgi:ribose transport system permease protein